MKNIKIFGNIISVLMIINLFGCNDWLDINPKTEIKEKELFHTESGFKDALTGVYIALKSENLYGNNLTFTFIEYLAQHWDVAVNTWQQDLSNYDYKNGTVEDKISTIYGKAYNAILLANNIIIHIDDMEHIFTGINYRLIKGEVLALRAFLHFEILRMFGPIPEMQDDSKILPYVTTIDKVPNSHISYSEYILKIESDLKDAFKLLNEIDPQIHYPYTGDNELYRKDPDFNPDDNFHFYRQQRMNFYAVKALLARFYLWIGKKEEAHSLAVELINEKNTDGSEKFPLANNINMINGDHVLEREHIFSIHIHDLSSIYSSWFLGSSSLERNQFNVLYYVFEFSGADVRYMYLWDYNSKEDLYKKFTIKKYIQDYAQEVIPLIRISEMYLIAAETAPTLSEGQVFFNKFLEKRDLSPRVFSDDITMKNLILNEYRKEFYAEGQLFYCYKRMNTINIQGSLIEGSEKVYVLPLPEKEINYIK